ncbi:MAG: hypothetical protein UFJ18_14940 [Blautia sp.]|nr:hypothetical protein [Blautia sp.]
MGESGETCLFPLYCEDVRLQQEMENMLYAIEEKNWCKVEKLKEKIETEFHLSKDYSENRQYLKRIETITRYRKKEINVQEAIEELRTALNETLGNIEPEKFPVGKILREMEILVIYNLASYYAEAGNTLKALAIYERLDEYFSRKDMINDYKPRYIIYVGYSNFLGLNGRHDDSIAICKGEIEWLRNRGKTNYLYNFYFNIGWNICEKIKKGLEKKERIQEAKCYVWTAYQLCSLYPENKKNLKVIRDYYNQMN